MQNSEVVGKGVVSEYSNDNTLQESAGETVALKSKGDFQRRPHRPARYRLIDKDGNRHGTYKCPDDARIEAERLGLGTPDMSDDEPDGWYLETTIAHKIHKR